VVRAAARVVSAGLNADLRPVGNMPGVSVPIACSLGAEDAVSQLDEWRKLLAQFPTNRLSATQLAVRLTGGPPALVPVIALAQREKACCPFFDFSFHVETDAVVLRVSVPDDATSILDDLTRST